MPSLAASRSRATLALPSGAPLSNIAVTEIAPSSGISPKLRVLSPLARSNSHTTVATNKAVSARPMTTRCETVERNFLIVQLIGFDAAGDFEEASRRSEIQQLSWLNAEATEEQRRRNPFRWADCKLTSFEVLFSSLFSAASALKFFV